MKNIFGSRLRELRGDNSQAKQAAEMGLTQQTWARWETGIRKPDIEELADLQRRERP